jgi:methionyl-tRNA formyltransferase
MEVEIGLVVTQPDALVGRKKILTPSPVKELALKHNLKIFQPVKLRTEAQVIIDLNPTLILTAAYGQILPRKLVETIRSYNLHGSILPKYRGGAPIQYALFNNDQTTGVTLMEMVYQMDAGDIIKFSNEVMITADDDYYTLTDKLANEAVLLVKNNIQSLLDDKYTKFPQDESKVTFAYTIKHQDEFLDFNETTDQIVGKVRGLSPNVGASLIINSQLLKVFKAQRNNEIKDKPKTIHLNKKSLTITTSDGAVDLILVQQSGKKQLPIKDFLNGQNFIKNLDHCD